MIGFFIALLSGALMSIQGVFNTQVTKTTGVWVSNGWVQITAFAVCLAAWLFTGRNSIGAIAKVHAAGRRNRGGYYLDCNPQCGSAGAGEIRPAYCDRPAGGFLSDSAVRSVRNGAGTFRVEKTGRPPSGCNRYCHIPVGIDV